MKSEPAGVDSLSSRNALVARVGRRLRECRRERGLTQAQLARKLKMRADTLSRIERGVQAASLETIERIARALEVPPVLLFEQSTAANPELATVKDYLRELTVEERQFVLRQMKQQAEGLRALRRARESR